jgi:hypothetical protein
MEKLTKSNFKSVESLSSGLDKSENKIKGLETRKHVKHAQKN